MPIDVFSNGSGTVIFKDTFLSVRLIREALEKRYRLTVLEESERHLKCDIMTVPWFPSMHRNATLDLFIEREKESTTITWRFNWGWQYRILLILGVVFFIEMLAHRESKGLFLGIMLFGFMYVFLDTRWIIYRVRRIFKSLGVKILQP